MFNAEYIEVSNEVEVGSSQGASGSSSSSHVKCHICGSELQKASMSEHLKRHGEKNSNVHFAHTERIKKATSPSTRKPTPKRSMIQTQFLEK